MTVRMEHTVTVTLGWDGKTSPHSAPGAPPFFLTNQNPGSAHGCWHGEKETGGLTLTLFPVTTESRRSFNFEASHYFTFLTFCKMEWGFFYVSKVMLLQHKHINKINIKVAEILTKMPVN